MKALREQAMNKSRCSRKSMTRCVCVCVYVYVCVRSQSRNRIGTRAWPVSEMRLRILIPFVSRSRSAQTRMSLRQAVRHLHTDSLRLSKVNKADVRRRENNGAIQKNERSQVKSFELCSHFRDDAFRRDSRLRNRN